MDEDDEDDDEEDADEDEDDDGEDASTAPGTRSTGRKADDDTQSVTSRRSSTKPAKAASLGRPPKSKKLTVGVQDAAELPPVSMRKQQQKQKKKVVKASRRDGRGTDGKSESYSFDTDFGYD